MKIKLKHTTKARLLAMGYNPSVVLNHLQKVCDHYRAQPLKIKYDKIMMRKQFDNELGWVYVIYRVIQPNEIGYV